MLTQCTAQVRVVPTPNKMLAQHKKTMSRVYITFNSNVRPNSVNSIYNSGDILNEDLPRLIARAVADLRASNFVIVE
jgi:hypothetical protein